MLNSRLFRLRQNQSRHFSTVLIRTNWYTISCKYSNCKKIREVICLAWFVPSISDNTFTDYTYKNALLHVPTGRQRSYAASTSWKNFVNADDDANNAIADIDFHLSDTEEKEEVYDLSGRRVTHTTHSGIYIENGKKVMRRK